MRQIKLLPKGLLLIVLGVCLLGTQLTATARTSFNKPEITEMTASDRSQLERQRRLVAKLVSNNFGYNRLGSSTNDIRYLQKILDKKLIRRNENFDLQALGVVLGDIMVSNLPVRWVMVKDQYGKSRALQFEDSDKLIFPVTMISRRVSAGLPVNVRKLYKETETKVKQMTYRKSRFKRPESAF